MKNYRIIEKKGEIKTIQYPDSPNGCYGHYCCSCGEIEEVYIARYIVQQKLPTHYSGNGLVPIDNQYMYKDLKEFNNLNEAKKFKRDLDLETGIIIE